MAFLRQCLEAQRYFLTLHHAHEPRRRGLLLGVRCRVKTGRAVRPAFHQRQDLWPGDRVDDRPNRLSKLPKLGPRDFGPLCQSLFRAAGSGLGKKDVQPLPGASGGERLKPVDRGILRIDRLEQPQCRGGKRLGQMRLELDMILDAHLRPTGAQAVFSAGGLKPRRQRMCHVATPSPPPPSRNPESALHGPACFAGRQAGTRRAIRPGGKNMLTQSGYWKPAVIGYRGYCKQQVSDGSFAEELQRFPQDG